MHALVAAVGHVTNHHKSGSSRWSEVKTDFEDKFQSRLAAPPCRNVVEVYLIRLGSSLIALSKFLLLQESLSGV